MDIQAKIRIAKRQCARVAQLKKLEAAEDWAGIQNMGGTFG